MVLVRKEQTRGTNRTKTGSLLTFTNCCLQENGRFEIVADSELLLLVLYAQKKDVRQKVRLVLKFPVR